MKLKLTLHRPDGSSPADIITTVDVSTTVGALADHLAVTDPHTDGVSLVGRRHTLVRVGGARAVLSSRTLVTESGLRSGSAVLVEPAGHALEREHTPSDAAVVRVVSGPDQGRSYPLGLGTNVIGREAGCEVRLSDPLASRQHAKLQVAEVVEIIDLGSANGLLVGDDVVDRAVLRNGDRVQIGDTVLAVGIAGGGGGRTDPGSISFNRSPRLEQRWEGVELASPEPPEMPRNQRFPILPLFAPLVLGLVIYLATHAVTSLIFVAMSPLLIVANAAESRISGRRAYREAVTQFRADIASLVDEAGQLATREIAARGAEHPSVIACRDAALGLGPLLWSRWPDLPAFGELRLGLGSQAARNSITLPGGRRNNRALWAELDAAVQPFATVAGVPIVARMEDGGALGVGGERSAALGVARALVVQAAALHSPAELVVAVLASTATSLAWDWVKWLPHCAGSDSPIEVQPLASTLGACDALVADLERIADDRRDGGPDQGGPQIPAVLVVVEDDAPMARPKVLALAARAEAAGIHLVWVADDVVRLPAICRTFVDVAANGSQGRGGFVRTGEQVLPLTVETVTDAEALAVARTLSPVADAGAGVDEQGDLPRSVSWLTLAGPELGHTPAAVLERWTESRSLVTGPYARPVDGRRPNNLRALVGQSVAGPHMLDLRTQGPHALVGGTTGSGKSELLQSWILGMASAHSPQRVTFLFVDYKGGSAFKDCLDLPHTVGLVTDLSPHLVARALISLSAELRFREHILNQKKAKDLVELERSGDPEVPPSLIIVVDEFAALVNEVPEFVDGVVNVAQRGRSLGLHLILATQRPAGVIKDNLRANTNLRMALRMADTEDSVDVLGSPEAAAFAPDLPGRAVSRSGPAHLVPFQAAYAGGWTDDQPKLPEIHTELLGFGPSQVWEVPQGAEAPPGDPGPTDIQRVVTTICQANALAQVAKPRLPWLDELASSYDLAKLPTARRDDELVVGVRDDPDHQSQPTVAFHPDQDGNLAIYGTGNAGKSAALRTIAVAAGLTVRGGPCHVYGLDFGASGLRVLEEMPHVGSIVPGSDHERLTRLLSMLRSTIDERAVRYARADAGTITDYRRITGSTDEPRILLLVDSIGAFRSAYEGNEYLRWFEAFVQLAADGRPVGVHVIVSADRPGALPNALGSLVQRRIVLRLADRNDYSTLGAPSDVITSSSPPGRGLFGEAEIQFAVLGGESDVLKQADAIRHFAAAMRQAGGAVAPPILRLGDDINPADVARPAGDLPAFAVAADTLAPVSFEPSGTFVVAGPPASGRTTTLLTLLAALQRWDPAVRLFYAGNRRSPLAALTCWEQRIIDADGAAKLAVDLPDQVGDRMDGAPPAVLIIEAVGDFAGGPSEYSMAQMIKRLVDQDHLVIGEGELSSIGSMQPLPSALRAGRCGIVLQPEQMDAHVLKAQFPRTRKSDFPPGRGLYVSRGGSPRVVQVLRQRSGSSPP